MHESIKATSLGQLVAERPARARIFEDFHLDYCCGGRKPMRQACEEKGLDPEWVAMAIADSDQSGQTDRHGDWSQSTLSQLIDHIQNAHHAYLKRELPRIGKMLEKLAEGHAEDHPELMKILDIFGAFRQEMEMHMKKEELILFPMCRSLEVSPATTAFHCGTVRNPIHTMIGEHNDAGDAMERMRALSHDYVPPAGACATYRAALAALSDLETDLHRHVHEENNILFPMALAAETALLRSEARPAAAAPAADAKEDH